MDRFRVEFADEEVDSEDDDGIPHQQISDCKALVTTSKLRSTERANLTASRIRPHMRF